MVNLISELRSFSRRIQLSVLADFFPQIKVTEGGTFAHMLPKCFSLSGGAYHCGNTGSIWENPFVFISRAAVTNGDVTTSVSIGVLTFITGFPIGIALNKSVVIGIIVIFYVENFLGSANCKR